MAHLRIGSRGSRLARWQADHVSALLQAQGHTVSIDVIKTTGDKILDVALSKVGTKGMFTKEIEEALLANTIDLAVHSLKDLPTELDSSFALAVVLEREDPRDAFISLRYRRLEDLPSTAIIGTSSLRRQAQLRGICPEIRVTTLRGNVDTRIRRLEDRELDGIILAAAGLKRLGLEEYVREYLPPEVMCPAAGQGALAIETRSGDDSTLAHLQVLDHPPTRTAVTCERALLHGLRGGCQVPIGAYAIASDSRITLRAIVAHPARHETLCEEQQGTDPLALGHTVAQLLLAKGAQHILDDIYRSGALVPETP